jgi:hypothetical protein
LVARLAGLAGADPLVVLAAEAFLARVLVALRFTRFAAAGLAFVAATYTLSVLRISTGVGVHHRKASARSNVALISAGILAAIR